MSKLKMLGSIEREHDGLILQWTPSNEYDKCDVYEGETLIAELAYCKSPNLLAAHFTYCYNAVEVARRYRKEQGG